jgi:ATP-dependent helicase HrpA
MELDWHTQIDRAMLADRHRLRQQRRNIEKLDHSSERYLADSERWQNTLRRSIEKLEDRLRLEPHVEYPAELPISAHVEQIKALLNEHQVLVVCGETGSGKSTQLPKICLDAGRGRAGMIGHTQPRRLAASSIANRLADELKTAVGEQVGFKIRFTDQTAGNTLIKLMTDGVLLAEISRDRFLNAYDTIIIDEAHERSLNIDILLGYLNQLLPRRPDLRVIITSATIDAERFAEHFGTAGRDGETHPAPIVLVEGRTYPVEMRYRDPLDLEPDESVFSPSQELANFNRGLIGAVEELQSEGSGDILVFLPTQRDILDAAKTLRGALTNSGRLNSTEILPLYSRLTESEQRRIFQPHSQRRIVLATNVAESSLTVPGIRYVIDSGTARISRYAPRSQVQRLPVEAVARASADQRAGRCGRVGPGICIRLYSEDDYLARPQFTTPEIRRANLAAVVLQTRVLGVGNPDDLPLLDPPRPDVVRDAINSLKELGAIADDDQLTHIGRQLSRWPVDPRVGRMLIEAEKNGVLADCLVIASGLEIQDPRTRPVEQTQAADEAHAKFKDPHSDFLSLLRIWDFYHDLKQDLGRGRLQRVCRQNFLSYSRLREWADVHRQLSQLAKEAKLKIGRRNFVSQPIEELETEQEVDENHRRQGKASAKPKKPDSYSAIHISLLSGLLTNIALLDDKRTYKAARGLDFQIWPGSGLRSSRPKWLMVAEIIETTNRYGRMAASIEPDWIEPLASNLIKYSYADPHFSRKSGAAMVYERGSLVGLPVVPRRRKALAPFDPETARRLLIDNGLAEGELMSRAGFYEHNQLLLEEIRAMADRTRSRDLVIDPFVLQQFYEEQLPDSVVDRGSLEKWDKTIYRGAPIDIHSETKPHPIYLTFDRLSRDDSDVDLYEQFPNTLSLGETQLPLTYRFEPGNEQDGVAIQVPEAVVNHLSPQRLEWLVPGMLHEKVLGLIKSLPKRLRRNLVPAADAAHKAVALMKQREQTNTEFWPTVCSTLSELADVPIRQSDFQIEKLSEHLRMRIEVLDESGETISATRNLSELTASRTSSMNEADANGSAGAVDLSQQPWYRETVEAFDFELPESIVVERSGLRVTVYPTLAVVNDHVRTVVADSTLAAERMLDRACLHLLQTIERRELRSQIKHLPGFSNAQLKLAAICSSDQLRDSLGASLTRIAFLNRVRLPRTHGEFEGLRSNRIEKLSLAAQEVGRWLPKLADAFHQLQLQIESTSPAFESALVAVGYQLDRLAGENFLSTTPWKWLAEYPRYFAAMTVRLEKAKQIGIAKDQEHERTVTDLATRIEELATDPEIHARHSNELTELTWHLEELRVSLFAQQLGTQFTISPKRVEKSLQKLK